MGEHPETDDALILQAGNHTQTKESLNSDIFRQVFSENPPLTE